MQVPTAPGPGELTDLEPHENLLATIARCTPHETPGAGPGNKNKQANEGIITQPPGRAPGTKTNKRTKELSFNPRGGPREQKQTTKRTKELSFNPRGEPRAPNKRTNEQLP